MPDFLSAPSTPNAVSAHNVGVSMNKNVLIKAGAFVAIFGTWNVQAQSGVTLYGFIDAGIYKLAERPTSLGNIQRSYWGLKGVEDLGNGYSATFNLMSRFEIGSGQLEASGSAPLFYGESTVGFTGPFGQLRLGRALTPMWARDGAFDPWNNFDRVASVAWQIYHPSFRSDPYNNGPVGDYGRVNHAVFYDTPQWSGWSVSVSAAVNRERTPDALGNVEKKRSLGAAINYDKGPLAAILSSERNSANDSTYFAAGAIAMGNTRLMLTGSLTNLSEESRVFLGEVRTRRSSMTFGATHRFDANTLKLGLGRDFQGYGTLGGTNYVSVGAEHALSKRTAAYVSVGYRKPAEYRGGTNLGVGMNHGF